MTKALLLPHRYKKIGWFILVPATILGLILAIGDFELEWLSAKVFAIFTDEIIGGRKFFSFINTNITNTVVGILFLVGALFTAFSREKQEDEYIEKLRLSSLLWAVWVNYLLLLLAFIFVYGFSFLNVMIYNMFTILIIFIARFNYILYLNKKGAADEK
jgi:small-conductance mechanosensitive channel